MKQLLLAFAVLFSIAIQSQTYQKIYNIIDAVSKERLKQDVKILVDFGTRHTLSDTVSNTKGIGAARRWIKSEFENISSKCNNCLEVFYQKDFIPKGDNDRITKDVWVVNVVAIQRGTKYPNRFVIMSGDIDSRVSDPTDFTSESPGANDNATGMAGAIEAARVLSKYKFENSIIYLGLSGEEQGLFGGKGFAEYAKKNGRSRDEMVAVWKFATAFNGYAFCKAHSAAYAIEAYEGAWLKAHYPAEFMAATMSSELQNTDKIVIFIEINS